MIVVFVFFFFSSRRRHTRLQGDWSSDVCSSDLEQAGLRVDNGIVVDDLCRTTNADIYAAGDVANFHNPALDSRLRVEHEDNARSEERRVGKEGRSRWSPYH